MTPFWLAVIGAASFIWSQDFYPYSVETRETRTARGMLLLIAAACAVRLFLRILAS